MTSGASTRRASVALTALLPALAVGTAFAAQPATLRAPREVRVGQTVTATARDLIPGHYRLYIGLTIDQGKGAHPVSCLAPVGPRVNVPSGDRRFRGKITAHLTCYQGTRIGTVPTTPGAYRFTVASPLDPGRFSGNKSFLKRRVRVAG
jgi:hypothetical protein